MKGNLKSKQNDRQAFARFWRNVHATGLNRSEKENKKTLTFCYKSYIKFGNNR